VDLGGRRLVARPDHDLVDVDVGRLGDRPADRLGDVLGPQRLHAGIDLGGRLLVALEADHGELCLDHARSDLGDADRLAQQLQPQGADDRFLGVLGCRVAGAAAIYLEGGDAGHDDDVALARGDQARQQGAGHPHRPQHVRLVHRPPQLLVGRADRVEPEGAAGAVDQHVAGRRLGGEGGDRVGVGHIQRDRLAADLGGQLPQPLEPAGAEDDPEAVLRERPGARGADPARGPGDDRGPHLPDRDRSRPSSGSGRACRGRRREFRGMTPGRR
jgi:hypothetical protein